MTRRRVRGLLPEQLHSLLKLARDRGQRPRTDAIERFRAKPSRQLVFGHRGASAHETENTLESIERAVADGADGVEIDVRLTRCGEVVVFHDDDLSRLSHRIARVADCSLAELRDVRLRGGGRISTLSEVLEAAGPDTLVNVEIKSPGPLWVSKLIDATDAVITSFSAGRGRILVSSFDPTVLWRLAKRRCPAAMGLLFDPFWAPRYREGLLAHQFGAMAVHPKESLIDARTMGLWKSRGLVVNAWTVDSLTRVAELAALGVDGIITNDPRAVSSALTNVCAKQILRQTSVK